MLRTAEEIFNPVWEENFGEKSATETILKAINKAREETIIACAEAAKSEWIRYGTHMGHAVDKQSILNLINELK